MVLIFTHGCREASHSQLCWVCCWSNAQPCFQSVHWLTSHLDVAELHLSLDHTLVFTWIFTLVGECEQAVCSMHTDNLGGWKAFLSRILSEFDLYFWHKLHSFLRAGEVLGWETLDKPYIKSLTCSWWANGNLGRTKKTPSPLDSMIVLKRLFLS